MSADSRQVDGGTRTGPSSVGLVHDYLLVSRGAERTFEAIAAIWPEAPIYALLYDPEGVEGAFADRQVVTSFLQRWGVDQRGFRRLLPLFPLAISRLELAAHDLVVSSSSAFAHGVHVPDGATHICYCHSPFRYAWHERARALEEVARPLRPALRLVLAMLRRWDLAAASRVTHYVANSEITRRRIEQTYGRCSRVVHPPVEVERFKPGAPEDYFLIVTELVSHKQVDVALEAARRARRPIRVVGEGPEMERLRSGAGKEAEFLGRVSHPDLARLYAGAAAFVMPNVEEFGIAAVEAMASGRPVIAAAAGGALETVVDDEVGILVPPGDVDRLAAAMAALDPGGFSPERIRRHAESFSKEAFQQRFRSEVERLLSCRPG